jgi:hypothetical protein
LDRAVWNDYISFEGGRIGHEVVIGLRFRGRGTVLFTGALMPVAL